MSTMGCYSTPATRGPTPAGRRQVTLIDSTMTLYAARPWIIHELISLTHILTYNILKLGLLEARASVASGTGVSPGEVHPVRRARTGPRFLEIRRQRRMSAIESETAAATAETTGVDARESSARENGERETNSSPARKRRPAPYTSSFRGFLEQLGENPREFDQRRRKLWDAFQPEDGFEEGLVLAFHNNDDVFGDPLQLSPHSQEAGFGICSASPNPEPRRGRGSEVPLRAGWWRRPIGGGARIGGWIDGKAAIDGGTPPVSRWMVTVVVNPRELIGRANRHFHHPYCHLGAKPVLQTNWI